MMTGKWMKKVSATATAAALVLGICAVPAFAAPKGQSETAHESKGAAVEKGKPAASAEETVAPALPECPAPVEPTAPVDATAPADTTAPADSSAPADTTAPADPCAQPTAPAASKPGNPVNLGDKGKAAEHNPNVGADGNLMPGTAGARAPMTEEEKAAEIASVKTESRAQAKAERAKGEKGAYLIYVNGERLNLTPIARSGRTLVPFRRLAEFLGATVSWEPSTQTVIMEKGDQKVTLSIGAATATVNGEETEMPVPPELVEGSTFVPLRFIATALGADVDYDEETGAITVITTEGTDTTAPATGDTATAPATGDTTTAPAPTAGN